MPKPVQSQLSGMRVGARMRAWIWMGSALAVSIISPSSGQDACAGLLADYGYFLQAQKSCSRDEVFGQMTAAKACAKTIPQAAGLTLIESGRRRWARGQRSRSRLRYDIPDLTSGTGSTQTVEPPRPCP